MSPIMKVFLMILLSEGSSGTFKHHGRPTKHAVPGACYQPGVCKCIPEFPFLTIHCEDRMLYEVPVIPEKVTSLNLSLNFISEIRDDSLSNLRILETLDLSRNNLGEVASDVFYKDRFLCNVYLSSNMLTTVHKDSFRGPELLSILELSGNNLSELPEDLFLSTPSVQELDLTGNRLRNLSNTMFSGISHLYFLSLSRNDIYVLPQDLFKGTKLNYTLDLSNNRIETIPSGIFKTNKKPHSLVILLLQRNSLTHLSKQSFLGLPNLAVICLFDNNIHTIEDGTFSSSQLDLIFLFGNKLVDIEGNPFSDHPQQISEIHLYGNQIKSISELALYSLTNDTLIFIYCEYFERLPRDDQHAWIHCVSTDSLPTISMHQYHIDIAENLEKWGFNCSEKECTPCFPGTYGDRNNGGCKDCPAGGFYQDEVGQVPANLQEMSCKKCNNGTYVKHRKGSSLKDCEVCPEGTIQSISAGFRACVCKENYTRTDRFGPCFKCIDDGLNCSSEFKRIRQGYFWNWDFPTANLSKYKLFAANLKMETRASSIDAVEYTEEIPRIIKCPRTESCVNDDGNIEVKCAKGYEGFLCSSCESGFYNIMNNCLSCPSKTGLIMQFGFFLSFCVLICYLFSWQVKRQAKQNRQERSIVDVIISRVKILLGFYQVVGELFASLNEVSWAGPLVVIGTFISYVELNILRVFVRPRCFVKNMVINPKAQFVIGVLFPAVAIILAVLVYQVRKLHLKINFFLQELPLPRSSLKNLKLRLITSVIVILFLVYPPVCSVIFELYPQACETFYLDKNNNYSIMRLRSDYDFDCNNLWAYHYSAYCFTVLYVISFPVILFYLLWRARKQCATQDILPIQEDQNSQEEENLVENSSSKNNSTPVWLNFLCENYKSQFWYWEIIELTRKVTQTLLVTLYGWENRLTVLLTTCISVLFLVLHARYRPMESLYEQRLQMFSLTVIFINVLVASNDVPEDHDDSVSTVLIVLNIVVLLIVAGEVLLTVVLHIKHSKAIPIICATLRNKLLKALTPDNSAAVQFEADSS